MSRLFGKELPSTVHDDEETFEDPPRIAVLQAAFRSVDEVDVSHQFQQRAAVMRSVPRFVKDSFYNFCEALKAALNEIVRNRGEADLERGWKLLLMLHRIFLPLVASESCNDKAASTEGQVVDGIRIIWKAQSRDVGLSGSICGQAFEGAELAPRNKATLNALRAVEYTFIQNRFHPMTLSSKHNFVQWHFHPNTISSNDTFIQNTFIQF